MSNTCRHCQRVEASAGPGFVSVSDGSPSWSCEACTAERAPRCDACVEPIWPEQAARALTIAGTDEAVPLWVVHDGCAPTHVLRCAWEAWDARGGAEEGGWTYEAGRLVAAVPITLTGVQTSRALPGEAVSAVDSLLAQAFPFDGRRRRLSLTFELSMPASSYPLETPRYE